MLTQSRIKIVKYRKETSCIDQRLGLWTTARGISHTDQGPAVGLPKQETGCSVVTCNAWKDSQIESVHPFVPCRRFPSLWCPRRAAVGSGIALAAHVAFSERARRQVNESTLSLSMSLFSFYERSTTSTVRVLFSCVKCVLCSLFFFPGVFFHFRGIGARPVTTESTLAMS